MKLKWIVFVVIALVVGVFLINVSIIRIGPNEVGVHTINLGSRHGIVQRDFGPGFHRNVWLLDTWNRFPTAVQRIRFAKTAAMQAGRPVEELSLKSAGGDRVAMTIEVVYHIADGKAHQVLQDSGAGRGYEDVVRNLTQGAVRAAFGGLKTEDFYNEASRESARQEAVTLLSDQLKQRHLELVDLLLETLEFDPNYENLIKEKTIFDQQVELEIAKAKAAEETGKVAKIKAETTAKIQKINKESEAQITRLRTDTDISVAAMKGEAGKYSTERGADATLYENEKKAKGQRVVKLAQAEGTKRLNSAMAGEGGRNVVALEAAKSLSLSDVTFPSAGFEWFNPYEMARRLGGTTPANSGTTPANGPAAPPAK